MRLISGIQRRVNYVLRESETWWRSHPTAIAIKTRLGIPARFHSPARTVLENTIIPYYAAQGSHSRMLFVGVDWYTKHYEKLFKHYDAYWTIDPDPNQVRWAGKNHIVDFFENLNQYFDPEYFDVIVCNGVLGHGLNDREPVEKAFDVCFSYMRPGGTFVLGWGGSPELLSFPLEESESLRRFTPFEFPPLASSRYSTKPEYQYVFQFFAKSC
ncbi:MAG: methyltransferase type 11 [Nitrospirales bacterium]|nr:MAG: methyltransferase type 11 [Nitrospirales bacterium]